MSKKWTYLTVIGLCGVFIYLFKGVLVPFLISGIFIYLLAPGVNYFSDSERKFPLSRGLSVALVYLISLIVLSVVFLLVLPPLYKEFMRIAQQLPLELTQFRSNTLPHWMTFAESWNQRFELNIDLQKLTDEAFIELTNTIKHQIEAIPHRLHGIFEGVMSALSSFLVIFIVTAFVLVDLPQIKKKLYDFVPEKHRKKTMLLMQDLNKDLSGTIRGQLMICLVNGVLTTIGLLILQVKFAVTIGFLAGVFSLIPVFGALISTVPAVLIGLTQSLWTALSIILLIIFIHLLEANVLNPKILGHSVELHPAIIVFAVISGEHFFGVLGLLLAVPVTAILRSVIKFVYQSYFFDLEPSEIEVIEATE